MRILALLMAFGSCGCAIAAKSDKFGADVEFGIGGVLSYVADVRFKASIGFMKSFPDRKKEEGDEKEGDDGADPLGLAHFL